MTLERAPACVDAAGAHAAVEGRHHPAQCRMADPFLQVRDQLSGIGLAQAPVQLFGHKAQLNHEIAGKVLWFGLPALRGTGAEAQLRSLLE
jgi:hypothetical protein